MIGFIEFQKGTKYSIISEIYLFNHGLSAIIDFSECTNAICFYDMKIFNYLRTKERIYLCHIKY